MMDLFSWSEGVALRDRGMAVADAAQERKAPGWRDRRYADVVSIAHAQPTVHVDDVLARSTEAPEHHNAWGDVWKRAIRNRVIRPSGELRASRDRKKHAHQYPVYQSLVYRQQVDE